MESGGIAFSSFWFMNWKNVVLVSWPQLSAVGKEIADRAQGRPPGMKDQYRQGAWW